MLFVCVSGASVMCYPLVPVCGQHCDHQYGDGQQNQGRWFPDPHPQKQVQVQIWHWEFPEPGSWPRRVNSVFIYGMDEHLFSKNCSLFGLLKLMRKSIQ